VLSIMTIRAKRDEILVAADFSFDVVDMQHQ
jgi:hypothetical protein